MPIQIANRGKMLVQALGIFLRQTLAQQIRILVHGVENTALPVHPALILRAEKPVEEAVRNLLGR